MRSIYSTEVTSYKYVQRQAQIYLAWYPIERTNYVQNPSTNWNTFMSEQSSFPHGVPVLVFLLISLSIKNTLGFFIISANPGFFFANFCPFHSPILITTLNKTNWKNRWWCARDSNLGLRMVALTNPASCDDHQLLVHFKLGDIT